MPASADRDWRRELTRDRVAVALDYGANLRGTHYVLCGSSPDSGVTSLVAKGCDPDCLSGLVAPVRIGIVGVAVSWASDTDPGGPWVAEIQVQEPGGDAFVTLGRFDVETS